MLISSGDLREDVARLTVRLGAMRSAMQKEHERYLDLCLAVAESAGALQELQEVVSELKRRPSCAHCAPQPVAEST